jgi:catalase
MTHFDHECIPERVVHARDVGAHGIFATYGNETELTKPNLAYQWGSGAQ